LPHGRLVSASVLALLPGSWSRPSVGVEGQLGSVATGGLVSGPGAGRVPLGCPFPPVVTGSMVTQVAGEDPDPVVRSADVAPVLGADVVAGGAVVVGCGAEPVEVVELVEVELVGAGADVEVVDAVEVSLVAVVGLVGADVEVAGAGADVELVLLVELDGLVGADVEVPDELEVVGADVGGVDVGAVVVGAVVVGAVDVGALVVGAVDVGPVDLGVFGAGVVVVGAVVMGAVVLGVFVARVVAEGTRSGPGAGDVVVVLVDTGGGGTDALDTGPDHTPSR